jgi:hypothetical protein
VGVRTLSHGQPSGDYPMTVCIAVICEKGQKIVAATDRMLSFNEFSADRTAIKFDSISDDWTVLWASDDISHILPIIHRAKDNLKNG